MGILEELINAYGVSGSEYPIRDIVTRHIKKHVDELTVDKFGNLIAVKRGKGPAIMLAAHMDEIGLMVKRIEDNGKIYISPVGGIEPITMIGERVDIRTDDPKKFVRGVITTDKISSDENVTRLPGTNDMFIDVGVRKKYLDKLGIHIGSYASFVQETGTLATKDFIYGKALDDRIGCYIMIELIKRIKKSRHKIYFVFTVQEEIGLYGARTSSYKIDADWAVAVDVTNSDDDSPNPTKTLGKGPSMTVKDAAMLSDKCIDEHVRQLAKKHKIQLQIDVNDVGSTDALYMSLSKGGVPATSIGVPVRNIHTTTGIAHMNDINNCIKLLEKLLENPPAHKCMK